MVAPALRKKLQGYIETMPEKNLVILKPLLAALAEPLYTTEPATPEEAKKAEKRIKEYRRNPDVFVPFNPDSEVSTGSAGHQPGIFNFINPDSAATRRKRPQTTVP